MKIKVKLFEGGKMPQVNDNGDLIIECSNEYDDLDRLLTIVNILKSVN